MTVIPLFYTSPLDATHSDPLTAAIIPFHEGYGLPRREMNPLNRPYQGQ